MSDDRSQLSRIQSARKWRLRLAGAAVAPLLFLVTPYGHPDGMATETIKLLGVVLILAAVFGRTWCTLYIGRKKRETLVTIGPYSLSRNPLYVFSMLGACGIGMATGSAMMGALIAGITFVILSAVVRHEESELLSTFGEPYKAYMDATPRWLAFRSNWRDADEIAVSPPLVLRTFRDSSLMLLCLPLFELIEIVREASAMPTVLRLP